MAEGIEVKIDAEAVQKNVVQAIMKSAIGEEISKCITEILTEKEKSWDEQTILEKAIYDQINSCILLIIRDEIQGRREELKAMMMPQLTDEAMLKMTTAAIESMMDKLR